ncbi:MAG: exo-alpha-sialidase, partial [Chloroflexi bacterium]
MTGILLRRLSLALVPVAGVLALGQPLAGSATAPSSGPTVSTNALVDLDHNLKFPQNKQNEPAITRDPVTGALVAGANDELDNPLCHDPTAPLSSPCPFATGEQISGYYVSTNNGASWTGGYLPGYDNAGIRRASGGDPSLDAGPSLCSDQKTFAYRCGVTIYYANLADPINPDQHFSEAMAVSRTHDDGKTWLAPSLVNALDKTSDFDDHEWIAVDRVAGSPRFGRVYLFVAIYCGECAGNGNVKLMVVHSDDEGVSWSSPVQVSAANNN